jgi:hypothetical protein
MNSSVPSTGTVHKIDVKSWKLMQRQQITLEHTSASKVEKQG